METNGKMQNKKETEIYDSSDTDSEIIWVNESKSKNVKRGNKLKKRNVKMTSEEDHKLLLIESGFDTDGMTEEEKQTIINVLLESKKDAFVDHSKNVEAKCCNKEEGNPQINNNAECKPREKVENEIHMQPGTSEKCDTDYNCETDYDSEKEKNFKRNKIVCELEEDDHGTENSEVERQKFWLSKSRSGKNNIEKKKYSVTQTSNKNPQDTNRKLKQRKMDYFSQILIQDEVEEGEIMEELVEKPLKHTSEDDDISVPQTPENETLDTAETNLTKEKHPVTDIVDDENDLDLTQPPESQDMFGFEQLIDKPVRDTHSYLVKDEGIQQEQSSRKKEETKTRSVFDMETEPFDADTLVEVMDSSTQIDDENDLCSPTKDDGLIGKQIDKGKQLFARIRASASKLTGRLSRKRKAEDSLLNENSEKGGKKHQEMDRETKENSGDHAENKKFDSLESIFQREVFEPCEPLCRTYRKMRQKTSSPFLFAAGLKNVDVQIKAILQYFDIYHCKLRQAQSQISKTMEWGEPVKVGQHLDKTIDCRRRGYVYDFLDSDSENVCDNNDENSDCLPSKSTEKRDILNDINQENKPLKKTCMGKNTPFSFSDDDDDFENGGKLQDQKNNRLGRVTRSAKKTTYFEENQASPDHDPEWMQIMEADTEDIRHSPDVSKRKRHERNKPVHTFSRRPLTRHASDLSNKSSATSPVSSTQTSIMGRLESPSKVSESSLDGLSQGSSLMLDDKGDLISTQVCVLKEKLPNLKVKPMINKRITQDKSKSATSCVVDRIGSVETSSGGIKIKHDLLHKTDYNLTDNYKNEDKRKKKIPFDFNNETKKAAPKVGDGVNLIDSDSDSINDDDDDEISFKNVTKINKMADSFGAYKTSVFQSVKKDKEIKRDESSINTSSPSKHPFRFSRIKLPVESPVKQDRVINADQNQEITILDEPDLRGDNAETTTSDTKTSDSKSVIHVRRGRKRNHMEVTNPDVDTPVEKVEMMSCPLCLLRFPCSIIEDHASECDGTVQRRDDHDDQDISDNSGSVSVSPAKKSSSSNTPRKLNSSGSTDEQDSDYQGKQIMCYICDQSFAKGKVYEQHVDECLQQATMRQKEADIKGYNSWNNEDVVVEKRSTRSKVKEESDGLLKKLDKAWEDTAEGYSSDHEKQTLKSILRKPQSDTTESEREYSGSDEYDYSPEKLSPKQESKPCLPGGWSLEELANSPIKTFVPIWCQSDSDGFKNQFENAKRKYENKLIKDKLSGKRSNAKGRKRKRRRKTGRKRAKKAKTE